MWNYDATLSWACPNASVRNTNVETTYGSDDEASNVSDPVSEKCLRNPEGPLLRREGKAGKSGITLPLEGCKFGTLDVI